MTPKQKLTVAILVIANVALILTVVSLVVRSSGTNTSSLPTLTSRPTSWAAPWAGAATPMREAEFTGEAPWSGDCQWKAVQLLAQAGLGGRVALASDGLLRFEIVHSLASGETPGDAAQLVWSAFDVAQALLDQALLQQGCEFTRVEIVVLAQGDQSDTRINASVSAADLAAFGAGELSEGEFIERVTYTISRLSQ